MRQPHHGDASREHMTRTLLFWKQYCSAIVAPSGWGIATEYSVAEGTYVQLPLALANGNPPNTPPVDTPHGTCEEHVLPPSHATAHARVAGL